MEGAYSALSIGEETIIKLRITNRFGTRYIRLLATKMIYSSEVAGLSGRKIT
jgi:hypothetical protein